VISTNLLGPLISGEFSAEGHRQTPGPLRWTRGGLHLSGETVLVCPPSLAGVFRRPGPPAPCLGRFFIRSLSNMLVVRLIMSRTPRIAAYG